MVAGKKGKEKGTREEKWKKVAGKRRKEKGGWKEKEEN